MSLINLLSRMGILGGLLLLTVSAAPASAEVCDDPDQAVLGNSEAFRDPYEALGAVDCWREAFEARGDRRAIFAIVYADVIERILADVEQGLFEDRAWMERFVTALADLYREAMVNHVRGQGHVPTAWKRAFEASASGEATLIQELLLGINAHYSHDLALAMDRAGMRENLAARRRDHVALNGIISSAIDDVQDRLVRAYAPGLARLDQRFGRVDETVVTALVRGSLDFAWWNARRMTFVPAPWVRVELAHFSASLAELVLLPNYVEPVLNKLREIEQPVPPPW